MKKFSTGSHGNSKPVAHGKGFPRHYYKNIALSEEDVVEDYTGSSSPNKVGMNRGYGKLMEWGHPTPFLKHNHVSRWLNAHLGQSLDKVFSEFRENLPKEIAYKNPWSIFSDYVLVDFNEAHPTWYEFKIDNQGHLRKNPEYRSWRRHQKPKYAAMCSNENKKVLEELEAQIRKTGSYGLTGPAKINKQLWVVGPTSGTVKKMNVYLTRLNLFNTKGFGVWDTPVNYSSLPKLSDDTVSYIKDNYIPVDVILTPSQASSMFQIPADRSYITPWHRAYFGFSFVVRKAEL